MQRVNINSPVFIVLLILITSIHLSSMAQLSAQQAVHTTRGVLNDSLNHENTQFPWTCEWDENLTGYFTHADSAVMIIMEYFAQRGSQYEGNYTGFVIAHEIDLNEIQKTALTENGLAYLYLDKSLYTDTVSFANTIKYFLTPIIETDLKGCTWSQANNFIDPMNNFKVFPNPVTSGQWITLYIPENGESVITVLDLYGRKVKSLTTTVTENKLEINISDLFEGFYIIRVMTGNSTFTATIWCLE